MMITVEEFVAQSAGVEEFEIYGKPEVGYESIFAEYDFFFREDIAKASAYQRFAKRKIERFQFSSSDGWITCELYIAD